MKAVQLFEALSNKKRNRQQHTLNGNWYNTRPWYKPHHKSHLWSTCVALYNGMQVFQFRDYASYFRGLRLSTWELLYLLFGPDVFSETLSLSTESHYRHEW